MKMKKTILVVASLIVLAVAGCGDNGEVKKDTVSFKLHWIPDAHQMGFWVALDKGIYSKYGLEVKMYPGGLDANPIRDVVGGSIDVGQVGGIEQVVTAVSEGLPIQAISAIHRKSPHALISTSDKLITSAEDLKGKTVAVAFGDTAEILLKSYLKKSGVEEGEVNFVPFRYDLTPLISGQVDAVTGFSTGQPVTLVENGIKPFVIDYSQFGVSSYGYTLVVNSESIAENVDKYKKFIQASREGWEFSFRNPKEAVALFQKRFPSGPSEARLLQELDLIGGLMLEQGELAAWTIESETVKSVEKMLIEQGVISQKPNVSIYSNLVAE